ncbi:hypothetical protein J3E68DRAFT_85851 [Trichoderma sp. SZMC 28012]
MTAKTTFCALDDSVYIGRDERAYAFFALHNLHICGLSSLGVMDIFGFVLFFPSAINGSSILYFCCLLSLLLDTRSPSLFCEERRGNGNVKQSWEAFSH